MASATSFMHSNEIIEALRGRPWKDDFKHDHEELDEDLGPLTAIYGSIGKSTYRRFSHYKDRKPSAVFRACVAEELYSGSFRELCSVRSNRDYRAWAKGLARHLDKSWREHLKYQLELPIALKLVNLLAKGLCSVSPLWPAEFKTIAPHLDVALDKFSLRPLACIEELSHLYNASMGSVKSFDEHTTIQQAITELCGKAEVPPVAYDFLTWNGAHPKTN